MSSKLPRADAGLPPAAPGVAPLTARKVVCVSHGFQSNYERGFCNGLAARGVRVTLLSSDRTDPAGLAPGVQTLNLRGSQEEDRPKWAKALNMLRYHATLLGYTLFQRRAIVHVFGLVEPPLWMGVVLGLWFRAVAWRYVLTVHDLLPHDRPATRWKRGCFGLSYRLAQRLVVHTERMRADLIRHYGVDAARVTVMEHGVEPLREPAAAAAEPLRQGEAPLILAFGHVAPYKGTDVLLQALEQAPFPFRLVIAGACRDAAFRSLLQGLIERHPRREAIEWRDRYVDEAELTQLFRQADALALPYRHIDQSGVLFQALRHGLPVIATRVGTFERYVSETVGVLAEPDDAASLAQALATWHARRADYIRQHISQLGQAYEWPTTVGALRDVYQEAPA